MSAISILELRRSAWPTVIVSTLAFWLSSTLLLDLVIMPGLYASGMMNEAGFASTGYLIFWVFNRLELLCAALVLTGTLAWDQMSHWTNNHSRNAIFLSILLLAIALVTTYILTPQMSALGLNLNLFEPVKEVPGTMNLLHQGYWMLEVIKLVAGGFILNWCYRQSA